MNTRNIKGTLQRNERKRNHLRIYKYLKGRIHLEHFKMLCRKAKLHINTLKFVHLFPTISLILFILFWRMVHMII